MNRSFLELREQGDLYHKGISVDCVVLAFYEGNLKVLLNKFNSYDKWMIPGGFVYKDESLDDAVRRHLKNRTGLKDVYLRQFYTFGELERVNIPEHKEILRGKDIPEEKALWYLDRFVSVGYYALVEYTKVQIYADPEDEIVKWFNLKDISMLNLYGDHKSIIRRALDTIYYQIGFIPIGYELLPNKFTMPELRQVYEAFLGKNLDRRNFQRKMLSIGLFEKLNETRKSGAHKSPNLYAFNKARYDEALEEGLQLVDWKFS